MFGQVDNIARFKPDFHRPVKTPGGKVLEIGNGFPHSLSLPDFDILFGLHPLYPFEKVTTATTSGNFLEAGQLQLLSEGHPGLPPMEPSRRLLRSWRGPGAKQI